MKNILLNSRGSAILQVMVAAAALIGVSTYMITSNQSQNKLQNRVVTKVAQTAVARDFQETLMAGEVCFNTFKKLGGLSQGKELDGLYNKNNEKIYEKGSVLYNQSITDIRLTSFVAGSGRKYQKSYISVTTSAKDGTSGYGGKTQVHKIPISLITLDNQVDTCVSDEMDSVLDALRRACLDLQGTFNESKAECENFYGANGPILKNTKEEFCDTGKGENCKHPYAGQKCTGVDVRGENHNNWVVKGFNAAGAMDCACVVRSCANPAEHCEGEDLGTDWCQKECPKGTKTTGTCAPQPPAICSSWSDWSPATDGTCSTASVTQTRNCTSGKTETQSQTVSGTKSCDNKTWSWEKVSSVPDMICQACPKSYRYYYNNAEVPASFSRPTCTSAIAGATYMVYSSWTASMSWAGGVNRTTYECKSN